MSSGADLLKINETAALERAETVLKQVNIDLEEAAANKLAEVARTRAIRLATKPKGPLTPEQILRSARITRRQSKKQIAIERQSYNRSLDVDPGTSKVVMCVRNQQREHSNLSRKYFKQLGLGMAKAASFVPNTIKYMKLLTLVRDNVFYGCVSSEMIRKIVRSQACVKRVDSSTRVLTLERLTDNLKVETEFEDLGLLCLDDLADTVSCGWSRTFLQFIAGDEETVAKINKRLGSFKFADPREGSGTFSRILRGFQPNMEELVGEGI